jgi:predicted small metal-binding protein
MPQELKKIACEPQCGFIVISHDEKELIEFAIQHLKKAHNMLLTERDAKAKIEPVCLNKNKVLIGK